MERVSNITCSTELVAGLPNENIQHYLIESKDVDEPVKRQRLGLVTKIGTVLCIAGAAAGCFAGIVSHFKQPTVSATTSSLSLQRFEQEQGRFTLSASLEVEIFNDNIGEIKLSEFEGALVFGHLMIPLDIPADWDIGSGSIKVQSGGFNIHTAASDSPSSAMVRNLCRSEARIPFQFIAQGRAKYMGFQSALDVQPEVWWLDCSNFA